MKIHIKLIDSKKILFYIISIVLIIALTNLSSMAKDNINNIFLRVKGNNKICSSVKRYLKQEIVKLSNYNVSNEITNANYMIMLDVSRNKKFKPSNLFNVGLITAPISYYEANGKNSCLINNVNIISDFTVIREKKLSEECWELIKSNIKD